MSFRLKTVLGIALIEAALLLILVLSSLHELRHIGEEQLKQRALTTATLFATTTADAVLASDLASLESFVGEVLQNPGLVYARVSNKELTLAQDGDPAALQRTFVADTGFSTVQDGVYDAAAVIRIGDQTYGRVEIGLEIAHLQRELQRATRNFSGIALSELVLSALFSLALGSLLTTQLRSLIQGTKAVAEGRFGYQVRARGKDEIAQAVKAFNSMSTGLARLMDENAEQRHDLQATSDLLTGLVDNLQSGVLMVDKDGLVLHANAGFTSLFAVPPIVGDLKGRPFSQVVDAVIDHYAHPRAVRYQLEAILSQGEPVKNVLFELGDGRFVETDYTPLIAHGECYAHLWNQRDVTERVTAQRQVHERRRQLDTVFELSPDGFVYFDAEGSVTSVNPAFCSMTGLTLEQVIGIHRYQFFSMLRTNCGVTDVDDSPGYRVIRTTMPKPRVLSCNERSLRDDRGNSTELVMYFRDITHQRELDQMKSDFLATAAHELRTPLASVYGFAELLLQFDHDAETRRDMLETIHKQASYLVDMLNELLDLARIEARSGKDFEIRRQPLRPLLKDAIDGFLPEDGLRRIVADLPEMLPVVAADSTKLQRVLNNVLSNAFKYSPEGGDVHFSVTADDDAVRIAITDKGMGMTPEQVANVFERFYRADKSGAIPGSGLGMSLVREIISIHGWDIGIDSKPGRGTTVTIVIPLAGGMTERQRKVG